MSTTLASPFDDILKHARPAPDEYASIPDEMKESRSWLVYKKEPGAENKIAKIPYDPRTGRKCNDPSRGVSFEEAKAAAKNYSGLGFYVEPPYVVLDIDACVNSEGDVAPYAAQIIREMNTFAELSVSGTGIHIWAKGVKPGTACRKGIEIYGTKRFLTISGNPVPTMPLEVRTVDIAPIYDRMLRGDFVESEKTTAVSTTSGPSVSRNEVIHHHGAITTKLALLMSGDFVENDSPFTVADEGECNSVTFESQSEAIAALLVCLAEKHNGDAEKINDEFITSSLYLGISKWNALGGKWERLGKTEIASAIKKYETNRASASSKQADFCEANLEEVLEVADVEFPDMPESAIIAGMLGDICREYFGNFPRSYAWPAILTVAGTMVPPPERSVNEVLAASAGASSQTNLYTALVGPIGSGKTQAIEYAVGNMGLLRTKYTNTKAGSVEGLLKKLATDGQGAAYFGTRQMLVDLDEWSHFFKKAGIENASFIEILNGAYNKPELRLTIARGEKIHLNCALSLVGGIVQDRMQDCFGAESIGGFHDRFLFGVCPTENPFQYYPFDFAESAQADPLIKATPVTVKIDKSVWKLAQAWKNEDKTLGRSVEVTVRCCAIIASFDRRAEIFAKDLERMRPFLDYQQLCRQLITPNPGVSTDAKMSNAILGWLKRHADNGAWANQRLLKMGIHNMLDELGPTAFNNTLRNLVFISAVQTKVQANDSARPSHMIRLAKGM